MLKPLISFDWEVKRLLRNKANFGILEGFLSELLHQDIKSHRILESDGNQESEMEKFNRVDILAKDAQKQLIIIEYRAYPRASRNYYRLNPDPNLLAKVTPE